MGEREGQGWRLSVLRNQPTIMAEDSFHAEPFVTWAVSNDARSNGKSIAELTTA
jgi:hypothetical protein